MSHRLLACTVAAVAFTRAPTAAFVMTNAGLMADASIEATRIARIE
jgi:hypothetical protein